MLTNSKNRVIPMWPDRGEALSRTIRAEDALTDLWFASLTQWRPAMHAALMPKGLTAAIDEQQEPEPEPQAVPQTSGLWVAAAAAILIPGAAALWALTFFEVAQHFGFPLPDSSEDDNNTLAENVSNIISSATGLSVQEINKRKQTVFANPTLADAAKVHVQKTIQPEIDLTPTKVAEKLSAKITAMSISGSEINLRTETENVIDPLLRDYALANGRQAAAEQNAAALTAAQFSEEKLDKVWICTLDSRTRDTHWAADGQRVPADGRFQVGNDLLEYPGDPSGSAKETINCRCRVGLLAPNEKLPDEVDRHTERLHGKDSTAKNRKGSQADEIRRRTADGVIRAREDPEGIGMTASTGLEENEMADKNMYRVFTDQEFAPLGFPTDDRRMLLKNAELLFRQFPMPLKWQKKSAPGHDDAFTVGAIESGRIENNRVLLSGYFLNSPEADEAAEQNAHGISNPSLDLADATVIVTDENGSELSMNQIEMRVSSGKKVFESVVSAKITGATLVATPAFDTRIKLDPERQSRDIALVAAIYSPRKYSAEFFTDPKLSGPTPQTVDENGRIFGHLALWNSFHRSVQGRVNPPHSPSNYAHFHVSPPIVLDSGERIPVGRLTASTGHADLGLSAGPALAHYDHTGTCYALVVCGEDEHGIWFSGSLAPWAKPEDIEAGVSAPLSGDWRDMGKGLDLIAALAVNTPGFAVRVKSGSDGFPFAMVASVSPNANIENVISRDDIKLAVREVLDERDADVRLAAIMAEADVLVGRPLTAAEQIATLLASVT